MAKLVDEAIDDAISYSTRPGAIDKIIEKHFSEPIAEISPNILEEAREGIASELRTTMDKIIEELDYQVIDRDQEWLGTTGLHGSLAVFPDGSRIMTISKPYKEDHAKLIQGRDPRGIIDRLGYTLRHEFLHATQDLHNPEILRLFEEDHIEWKGKFNEVSQRSTRKWLRDVNDAEGKKAKENMVKTLLLRERSRKRAKYVKDFEQVLGDGDVQVLHDVWAGNLDVISYHTNAAGKHAEMPERVKSLRYEMVNAGIIEHLDEPITKAHADQLLDHWWEKSIHGIGVKPGQDMPNPDELVPYC